MIGALAVNALSHVIRGKSDEPEALNELKMDNMTHAQVKLVENDVSPPTQKKTGICTDRNANNIVNTIKSPMGRQDQTDKQTQTVKIQNMKKSIRELKYKHRTSTYIRIWPNF